MSRNKPSRVPNAPERQKKSNRNSDARVRRTHERLGMAMMELIRDNPINTVRVQDVLDRARVGRSTFYLHFRDKNDLLLSQLEQFLDFMSTRLSVQKEASLRVVPVTEMFGHVAEQRKLYRSLADSGALNDFFDLAQDYFARGIERRLKEINRVGSMHSAELRIRAVVLAGSLLSLLRWYMSRGAKDPPAEIDELFHRMVWKGME